MKKPFLYGAIFASLYCAIPITAIAQTDENPLNLDEIIQKALDNSPSLKAYHEQALASLGEVKQVASYDNPELTIEAENIAGSGQYKGYDAAENTYGISQKITLPGKYSARVEAAKQASNANNAAIEAQKLDLIETVKKTYAEYAASTENLAIAHERAKLSDRLLKNITKRVNAAADPLFQKSKAEVAKATSLIELQQTLRDQQEAKNNIALLTRIPESEILISAESFDNIEEVKVSEDALLAAIDSTPDALILASLESQAKSQLDVEKSNALPDPTISLGLRDFRETKDQAMVLGLSIPIPVFDQNRGNIIKAQHQVTKVKYLSEAKLLEIKSAALNSLRRMNLAYTQANDLRKNIIPAAEKAYAQASDVYNRGRFSYLEVSDIQAVLYDAKFSLSNTLKEYHQRKAEIEKYLPITTTN